jgi:hypothetical protein
MSFPSSSYLPDAHRSGRFMTVNPTNWPKNNADRSKSPRQVCTQKRDGRWLRTWMRPFGYAKS